MWTMSINARILEATVEARIARLESDVAHLKTDVSELRSDMKAANDSLASIKATIPYLATKADLKEALPDGRSHGFNGNEVDPVVRRDGARDRGSRLFDREIPGLTSCSCA